MPVNVPTPENITLFQFNKQKNVDKVYSIDICQNKRSQWVVSGFYGRRGYRQKTFEVETTSSYLRAKAAYDEKIQEKLKKGYTTEPPTEDPLPLTH
mgnify:CR=1 FL=1